MFNVDACISCGSPRLARYVAAAEPFIVERVPALRGAQVRLARCRRCGLAFFEPRLDEPELNAVYDGYRSPEYQRARQRHEPSYTPEVNAAMGTTAQAISVRRANTAALLSRHLSLAEVRSVLDYGGDRGQFIPAELAGARRVVYDVSGVEPLDGIVAFRDWSAAKAEQYDLVLCNHVLEHVTSPRRTIEEVASVTHAGSWAYFEVPRESPFDLRGDHRISVMFKRMLFESTALTNWRYASRGFRKMHEHISFFTRGALARAVEAAGLDAVETWQGELDLGYERLQVVSCLARPRAARG